MNTSEIYNNQIEQDSLFIKEAFDNINAIIQQKINTNSPDLNISYNLRELLPEIEPVQFDRIINGVLKLLRENGISTRFEGEFIFVKLYNNNTRDSYMKLTY